MSSSTESQSASTKPAPRRKQQTRLMRNMPIGRKMAVVVGAMIIPLLTLMAIYAGNQWADIRFVRDEIEGLAYYHPLEEIGGVVNVRSAEMGAALAAGEAINTSQTDAEIDKLMVEMDELDKQYGREGSSAKWQGIQESWAKLKTSTFKDLESSLAGHEELDAKLSDLRLYIATEWGMALDPVAESYYILDIAVNKVPELANGVGTTRGLIGASIHGAAQSAEIRLEMIRHAAIIDDRVAATIGALDVVKEKTAGDPKVAAVLSKVDNTWIQKVQHWTKTVGIIASEGKTSGADYQALLEEGNSIPDMLDTVHDQMMDAAHVMVESRERGLMIAMVVGVTLVLLLCALSVKLAHAVSWRVIGAIRRLKDLTTVIASGKFDNQIEADGGDEIAQLFSAVNQMQVQLGEDRANRIRYAAEIRRMSGGLAATSASVMIADESNNIIYLNDAAKTMFGAIEMELRKDLPAFNVSKLVGQNIDVFHKNPSRQQGMLAKLTGSHAAKFIAGGKNIGFTASPIYGDEGQRLGTVVEWVDQTAAVHSEREIDAVVDAFLQGDLKQRIAEEGKTGFYQLMAKKINVMISGTSDVVDDVQDIVAGAGRGDLSRRVQVQGKSGLTARLGNDVNGLVDTIGTVVEEVQGLVLAANQGDLTKRIETEGKPGLLVKIGAGINELTDNMAALVSQVKLAASEVSRGADEISQGNANLSQRTEEQASSLEETASSMEEMTSTVKQNADNAGQASQLAVAARDQAEKGGAVVSKAVRAMSDINDASKKIADIIGVIDEIAFQTNLLALNAAVEAARAGEQGRGFAVVASEVRNLAGRSATAAKEIKALIQDSVKKVDEGSNLVTQSGATLEQIVSSVKKVTDIVAEIAAASNEQSAGIEQVNKAVMQLDELTQQNAALVEQASAASQAMAEQARGLNDSMQKYQVNGDVGADQSASSQASAAPSVERRKASRPWAAKRPATQAIRAKAAAPAAPVAAAGGSDEAVWKEF
ncbi:MAG: HAMP domain-containing protein [Proteobacteria bacterium]|nr:HAMP domain-containing protein [Pseudomonadota bacterium]